MLVLFIISLFSFDPFYFIFDIILNTNKKLNQSSTNSNDTQHWKEIKQQNANLTKIQYQQLKTRKDKLKGNSVVTCAWWVGVNCILTGLFWFKKIIDKHHLYLVLKKCSFGTAWILARKEFIWNLIVY